MRYRSAMTSQVEGSMSDKFKALTDGFYVSPQIIADDIKEAKNLGIKLIISNRPDSEEPGQPLNASLAEAAKEQGIAFVNIPIDHRGVSKAHIEHFKQTLGNHEGPVLAFCRSGTRSTILRAFVRASEGDNVNGLVREASAAGYDLYTIVPGLEAVAPDRRNKKS